jgi:hypothetical protein
MVATRYRKHALLATLWLRRNKSKKACYELTSRLSMCHKAYLVGTERFELSTYGLRVRCSTS